MEILSTLDKLTLSESFGGIASWYGLRGRPAGGGGTPKNESAVFSKVEALKFFPALKDESNVRHGVICYPTVLTELQISSFELIPLNKVNGIENRYMDSLPTGVLQQNIISLLAIIISKEMDSNTMSDLEDDGRYIIHQAFKQTKIFSLRKLLPKHYEKFYECMKTINPQAFIAKLTEINEEERFDVKH
jgi:hypothetical protein